MTEFTAKDGEKYKILTATEARDAVEREMRRCEFLKILSILGETETELAANPELRALVGRS